MIAIPNKLVFWLQLVGAWTVAFLLLGFLRNYGWPDQLGSVAVELAAPGLTFIMGFIIGTGTFLIELLMKWRRFRRLSFRRWVALKSLLHLLLAFALFAIAIILYPLFSSMPPGELEFRQFFFSKLMLVFLVYLSVVSTSITLFQQMSQKMGKGILWNMLRGRYHHPREEERIFLFIDLKSSTTIAEELGHVRFSNLIQDCFADITEAVVRHDAEIYQYVGDEVILCWKLAAGLHRNNCIEAYFQFVGTLAQRAEHYRDKYGIEPYFKAGAHAGRTTVAEVGVLKRELAYHGDVLNTAARIQSKCNALGEQLLISPALASLLRVEAHYDTREYAPVELVGKRETMQVVGVRQRPPG
ncbi:adenylate cyclase [Lewinella marina]|uniref:Guanylate cyclase domain-containing protein n=1 Tax=Neolewinella marina TaxID=438751 RepID=A0A2G0CDP2_9BACT|nr:adenylate/guanylate cyclase domain-containing protein [Neolewinella marina]NJB85931.1 adenylate cyclase [Neolewinella marina]PHK98093.1 hypothetical protein CGL56_12960 [Neolewinella marina]